MSTSTLFRRHPRTGAPLRPLGYRKDGRAIWPILGGSEPPNQPPAPPGGQPPPPPAPPSPAGHPAAERPDGISDAEWNALGDPGKAALVRERQRATAAEQALAAARAPKPTPPAPPKPTDPPKGPDGQPDWAAMIQQAVQAATAPLLEQQAQRDAEVAAAAIREAVTTAAEARFHDATDALAQVDLAALTDGNGRADQQKITQALDNLLARKPHLGKVVDNRRHTAPGSPVGANGGGAQAPLDDRVKATLARMQQAAGVKFADA